MATDTLQGDEAVATSWDEAFANYQREEAAYAASAREYEMAIAAYDAERVDRDDEFTAYGLKAPELTHGDVMSVVVPAIMEREFGRLGYPLYPPKDVEEYNAKYPAIMAEAAGITADYLDWRRHGSEAYDRLVSPAETAHDAACDKLWGARNRLLGAPAPDVRAMLIKLDLLASIMAESDSEDGAHVATIRDDAHRFFPGE